MKKVLIIVNSADKYASIVRTLSDANTDVSVCSYKELCFTIDGDQSSIIRYSDKADIKEFSKILVLSTSPNHLQNYIFSALACYCRKYDIPMLDDSFSNTDGKLYALWRFWENNIPVAKTFFGPMDFMTEKITELGEKGILKSVQGTKGKDNYLINSPDVLRKTINNNPEKSFILQNFIPNNGDWRIILANYNPELAIYRSSHGKDYRNNTSVGGDAKLIPLERVDPKILDLSINASKALSIKIAGADIMRNDKTGAYTVLEVNRTPQLVTGAFTDEKQKVIQNLIRS
jgi:glutathione synthase/RimK-type ligase-like ATP-grasp enzyme